MKRVPTTLEDVASGAADAVSVELRAELGGGQPIVQRDEDSAGACAGEVEVISGDSNLGAGSVGRTVVVLQKNHILLFVSSAGQHVASGHQASIP